MTPSQNEIPAAIGLDHLGRPALDVAQILAEGAERALADCDRIAAADLEVSLSVEEAVTLLGHNLASLLDDGNDEPGRAIALLQVLGFGQVQAYDDGGLESWKLSATGSALGRWEVPWRYVREALVCPERSFIAAKLVAVNLLRTRLALRTGGAAPLPLVGTPQNIEARAVADRLLGFSPQQVPLVAWSGPRGCGIGRASSLPFALALVVSLPNPAAVPGSLLWRGPRALRWTWPQRFEAPVELAWQPLLAHPETPPLTALRLAVPREPIALEYLAALLESAGLSSAAAELTALFEQKRLPQALAMLARYVRLAAADGPTIEINPEALGQNHQTRA